MPKFEENALYVGGKCSKKLAMLKKILMLFMSENAKNYAGLFYRWLPVGGGGPLAQWGGSGAGGGSRASGASGGSGASGASGGGGVGPVAVSGRRVS